MFGPAAIGIGIVAILFGLLARAVGKMNLKTGEAEVSGSLSLGAGSHAGKRALFIGKMRVYTGLFFIGLGGCIVFAGILLAIYEAMRF